MIENIQYIKLNGVNYNQGNLEKLQISNESNDSCGMRFITFSKIGLTILISLSLILQVQQATKSIQLAKASMRNSARMTNQFFGLTADKTALLCYRLLILQEK